MKVNVVSLIRPRPPAAFLGRLTDKESSNPTSLNSAARRAFRNTQRIPPNAPPTSESSEIHGCLADAGEQRTKRRGRLPHKQPRFHIKTFLSKPGVGRTIVYAPGKQILF